MTGFPFLLLALGMSCVCYAFKLRIFLSDLSAYRTGLGAWLAHESRAKQGGQRQNSHSKAD